MIHQPSLPPLHLQRPKRLLAGIWANRPFVLALWFGGSFLLALQHVLTNDINNYIIYKDVYVHTLARTDLFQAYPDQGGDLNHYGPLFSLVIAPFAWMPNAIGVLCWVLCNAALLLFAVRRLSISDSSKTLLLLLCANELMVNSGQVQTNALECACLLLSFSYIERGKESKALFFIMAGAFIKLYAITGLAFFFFSGNKKQFVLWALLWAVVFFLAPALISNIGFVIQSYKSWSVSLQEKSVQNVSFTIAGKDQNVSVMGMIRRIFYLPNMNDNAVLLPGVLLFASQYLHRRYFNEKRFRHYLLCSVLLFTVIFSNSAESSTYIMPVMGMCLWFLFQPRTRGNVFLFAFLFFFTTFLYSDLLGGGWLRHHFIKPYSLKAFCPLVLWLILLVQIHTKQFLRALQPDASARPVVDLLKAGQAA